MKTKLYASFGGIAAMTVALAIATQNVRDAQAQQATGNAEVQTDTQADAQTNQADQTQQNQVQTSERNQIRTRQQGQVRSEQRDQLRTNREGQTTTTRRDTTRTDGGGLLSQERPRHEAQGMYKASDLIGMNVRGRTGDDNIGSIDDLMVHEDGQIVYAAVSFGGFLGIGDAKFAVPFDAIEFVREDNDVYARIDATEESLQDREGFDQDNWPTQPDAAFRGQATQRQADRPTTTQPGQTDLQR